MWAYSRSLPQATRPRTSLIINTILKLVSQGYRLLVGKRRKVRYPGYACDIARVEVQWLAYTAFQQVLRRRQAKHADVLSWLDAETRVMGQERKIRHGRVSRV
ncbi:hypothetical protein Micbo1qcDRAFT_157508 [Microdochium bolleyi]|uniref:Uncharacterized protein n=1 Tax=Microdochium bolleyi TaxID=196109 RepID=A0A136JED6_9PEZI|nr:hypothetical protein Micbo1qcDRAFT_157508 [Microdochium bolleyi]